MALRCYNIDFTLYREEGGDLVEGVENFKYLWLPLDQMDNDWTAVWKNTIRTR